ncbi:MAG: class I SAM-dependent methyltransferase [Reyranella sp.]|uniref:class I SAM-dependent methyltransferase n=1 Tax=Reyranella sp. TaxID=1929291 RepID=UPI0025E9B2C8|nr:class I SAM-dependent methyltransferase [Reyranella sp.]MBR2813100.1 class I SAM-dependent methyltransferase [Reyranella sp.]
MLVTCHANPPDRPAADASPVAALPESYGRWRRSRLGRITDTLEECLILDLLRPVNGLDVLDLGCGDGELASRLARRGARVTGLDADPRMLIAAHRRAEMESVELTLVRGSVDALPFPDASFDRVVAVTVLCFVRDADRAVAEMARVLRPGGHVLIGDLGRWSLWAAIRRIRGWLGAATWKAARFRTARELRALATAHALVVHGLRGSIYYPPYEWAASLLARFDPWMARWTTFGAAFIAVSAGKPGRKGLTHSAGTGARTRRRDHRSGSGTASRSQGRAAPTRTATAERDRALPQPLPICRSRQSSERAAVKVEVV